MAVGFSKSVKAGEVKVKQESEDHSSSGGNGQTIDAEDIPF
jgi:hypothetical protein